MKNKPEIVVQKRQDRPVFEANNTLEMCSCGSRPKHKCIKENGLGTGKMCVRG